MFSFVAYKISQKEKENKLENCINNQIRNGAKGRKPL